jgi:hypothetical protein
MVQGLKTLLARLFRSLTADCNAPTPGITTQRGVLIMWSTMFSRLETASLSDALLSAYFDAMLASFMIQNFEQDIL